MRTKSCTPASTVAYVSLSVNAGSFLDPIDYGGLAHFLEHMIFMGSKTYPGENEFEEFVSQNGGGSNAYTEYESTTYYFHVKEDALYGALLRFAALLENPLL